MLVAVGFFEKCKKLLHKELYLKIKCYICTNDSVANDYRLVVHGGWPYGWPSVFLYRRVRIPSVSRIQTSSMLAPNFRRLMTLFLMYRSVSPGRSMIMRLDCLRPWFIMLLKARLGLSEVKPSCSYQNSPILRSGHLP